MEKNDTDYVRLLTYNTDDRMKTLRALSIPEQAVAFGKLSPYVQQTILKQLRVHEIVNLLDHMDMQQVEKVLTRIQNAKLREKIIQRLKGEVKEKLEYFLRFHPKATLSLINFNYLFLDGVLTIKEAAELISEHYDETARYPEVLVHDQGQLMVKSHFRLL
jgi:Mg/Co/Ni transporter MgtE